MKYANLKLNPSFKQANLVHFKRLVANTMVLIQAKICIFYLFDTGVPSATGPKIDFNSDERFHNFVYFFTSDRTFIDLQYEPTKTKF